MILLDTNVVSELMKPPRAEAVVGWSTAASSLYTASANWHEKVAGIDAGADDYLTKPNGIGCMPMRVLQVR